MPAVRGSLFSFSRTFTYSLAFHVSSTMQLRPLACHQCTTSLPRSMHIRSSCDCSVARTWPSKMPLSRVCNASLKRYLSRKEKRLLVVRVLRGRKSLSVEISKPEERPKILMRKTRIQLAPKPFMTRTNSCDHCGGATRYRLCVSQDVS